MRLWNPLFWLTALIGGLGRLVAVVVMQAVFGVLVAFSAVCVSLIWLNGRLQGKALLTTFGDAVETYLDKAILGDAMLQMAYKGKGITTPHKVVRVPWWKRQTPFEE